MSNNFYKINSSSYEKDPIFSNIKFEMYGNSSIFNCPLLFLVDNYSYVLITPTDISKIKISHLK